MKKILQIITIISVFSGLLFAQLDDDLARRINQFQIKLNKLQLLSERYDNQHASDIIIRAINWFRKAQESWRERKFREARAQLLESIKLYEQASRLLLFKPALNIQRTLDEAIHRAEISLQKNESRDGRYMLNKARDFQLKAHRQINISDYIKGQEYMRIALHFARKAVEISERTRDESINRYNYENELQHIQNLYRELHQSGANNRQVDELLQKAETYIRKSKKIFDKNDERQAFNQLQIAEKLLFRALDISDNNLDKKTQRFEQNLNSLRRFINNIELNINDIDNANALKFYQKATKLMTEAERNYSNGNFEKARTNYLLAQRLANRALRFSESLGEQESVRINNRIEEIERIIQLQKQKIENEKYEVIVNLHKETEELLHKAKRELDAKNETRAFQLVRLSLRLVNRIDFLLQREKVKIQSADELKNTIQKVENRLNSLLNNTEADGTIHKQTQMLKELLDRVKSRYENKDLETSLELIRIIQSQFKLILDKARE